MKKILKIVLICVGIVILLCLVHIVRNVIIINKLKDNFSNTKQTVKTWTLKQHRIDSEYGRNTGGQIASSEYYKKGNKHLWILEGNERANYARYEYYTNNNITNLYMDNDLGKVVKYNENTNTNFTIPDIFEKIQYAEISDFKLYVFSLIRSANYNGRNCYIINIEGIEFYIEKDTGLCLKDFEWDSEYSFDEIDDNIFVEPDANEYQDYDKIPKESLLMNGEYAPTEYLYRNSKYKRAEISKINLKDDGLEISNAIEKWDISYHEDGSVMAYITSGELIEEEVEENNERRFISLEPNIKDKAIYELTIVGNGKIHVLNCQNLFASYNNCKEITGLECLDTSDTVTMSGMFWNCGAINIDLSQLDTSKVTDMSYMFKNYMTEQLDLSSFNTVNLKNTEYMFEGANIDTVFVRDTQDKELFQTLSNTINFEVK